MNRFVIDGHTLAYRDEGRGAAVVFVHGTPSSSAEFAPAIAALRGSFRCVAIDHLGFGASDKPARADYSIAGHRARLAALLSHLGINDYHLVVHDFGGAIALPLAMATPGRVLSVTLINTWLWPLEETETSLRRQKRLLRSPLMTFLYRYLNFSARVLVKAAWGSHRPLERSRHREYQQAFTSAAERSGTVAFLRALTDSAEPAWRSEVTLDALRHARTQLLWGMGDRMITPATLRRWTERLPAARVVELPKVGHFVADEAPELVVEHLRSFLAPARGDSGERAVPTR